MTKEEKNGIIIMTKGILASFLIDGYEGYTDDEEIHLNLIKGIGLLVDEDPLFFAFSDIGEYDVSSMAHYVISDYRDKYNNNREFCNEVTKKINGLNIYSPTEKADMRIAYIAEQQIDRDRVITSLYDLFYSIVYDSNLYYAILSGDLSKLSDYQNIIDSTIYLYNNYNEIFDNEIIRNNDLYLIDSIINNSKRFSAENKCAKKLKKTILTEKVEY